MASEAESKTALPLVGSLAFQASTWYLLARTGAVAYQRWADMLARLKVTPSQYKVVMALGETGPLGQQRLAELVGIDPRNAVPIIETLVEQSLVRRQVDPADRRRRVLQLTAKGQRLADKLASIGDNIERDFLHPLAPTDQPRLQSMLLALLGTPEGLE